MSKRSQKYGIVLAFLCIVLQVWVLSGRFPWIDSGLPVPPKRSPSYARALFERAARTKEGKPRKMQRPDFQTGMIFPQWGATAYGGDDANWQTGLRDIQEQTAAQWISMTINFSQLSPSATQVQRMQSTPTPEAVTSGIRKARAMGYHVFLQPLITLQGEHPWAGSIQFATERDAQAWFDSYWRTFEPFVAGATQAGAEELALGTEYEQLQGKWSTQWNQLIARAHAVFPGMLTYDMNWTSVTSPLPSWMHTSLLASIGVSVYIPLTGTPQRLQPNVIAGVWREKIGKVLDELSVQLKKPVLISEIGYRDSPDALYKPWAMQTLIGTDPEEQAAAYDAALRNVIVDAHIVGIFFWAWSFPPYQPNSTSTLKVLYHWYTSPLA